MANDELFHYGIKGMHWGIRRYQKYPSNYIGKGKFIGNKKDISHRNMLRKRVKENIKSIDDVNNIVKSLSDREKKLLGVDLNTDYIQKNGKNEYDISSIIAKRFIAYDKILNTPVSFLDIYENTSPFNKQIGAIAVATKSGDEYRGKGYASNTVKAAINWYNKYGYKKLSELQWYADKTNDASNLLAEKYGFIKVSPESLGYDSKKWNNMNIYKYSK